MKIDLKKIFRVSSSRSTVVDNVKIIRSPKRLKTMSLQIKNGVPIIYCPTYIKDSYLRLIIKKKQLWIKKKINAEKDREKILVKNNSNFPFLGRKFTLITLLSKKNKVFLKNNSLVIQCTEFKLAKKNLVEWLKLEAKKYLVDRVQLVSSKIKINFKSLNLKSYRAMWGSCNSRSEISLNWKLVMLPKKVIDYVIVHELCHIVEPNHSKSFWSLVKKYDNEYIENKNWLKKNGIEVIKF